MPLSVSNYPIVDTSRRNQLPLFKKVAFQILDRRRITVPSAAKVGQHNINQAISLAETFAAHRTSLPHRQYPRAETCIRWPVAVVIAHGVVSQPNETRHNGLLSQDLPGHRLGLLLEMKE